MGTAGGSTMGMGPTLGVVAHNVPKQDDSMQLGDGQHLDSGTLENWAIRSKPPAPPSEPPKDSRSGPLSALTDAEISRQRRQWLVLTGVCLFALLIFSLAALRALLG
jgi:hypothetical protein